MEVQLTGLNDVLQNLMRMNIDESLENKALTKAGKVTQEAAIEEAPVDKRNPVNKSSLHKNIKLRRPKDGEVVIHTGGAYHAHLVEFGRSGGSVTLKNGRKVKWGPTAPNPFFSRAFERSVNQAKQTMINEIQRGLGL